MKGTTIPWCFINICIYTYTYMLGGAASDVCRLLKIERLRPRPVVLKNNYSWKKQYPVTQDIAQTLLRVNVLGSILREPSCHLCCFSDYKMLASVMPRCARWPQLRLSEYWKRQAKQDPRVRGASGKDDETREDGQRVLNRMGAHGDPAQSTEPQEES